MPIHAKSIGCPSVNPERWPWLLDWPAPIYRHPTVTNAPPETLQIILAEQIVTSKPMLMAPEPQYFPLHVCLPKLLCGLSVVLLKSRKILVMRQHDKSTLVFPRPYYFG